MCRWMQPLGVAREWFDTPRHRSMVRLLDRLEQQPWIGRLVFSSSMFELLVARAEYDQAEINVMHADGCGRPEDEHLDVYHVRSWSPSVDSAPNLSLEQVVQFLARWLEAEESKSQR